MWDPTRECTREHSPTLHFPQDFQTSNLVDNVDDNVDDDHTRQSRTMMTSKTTWDDADIDIDIDIDKVLFSFV